MLLALGGPAVPAGAQAWTAQEIVDRAVARADAQREAQDDVRYLATFEAITERLNGELPVTSRTVKRNVWGEGTARRGRSATVDRVAAMEHPPGACARACVLRRDFPY